MQMEPSEPRAHSDLRPRVSAIVVSYHTGDVLFDCITALRSDDAIREIVVVDNGNPPAVRAKLEAVADSRLKLAGDGTNVGFAAGVNRGVKAAAGDRLLIINPDAILGAGAVSALEAARDGAHEPAIIGGKIVGEDGREQRGGRRRRLTLASAAVTFMRLGWLKAVHPAFVDMNMNEDAEPAGPVPVGAVSGALMYMSREGFDALGGFDEGYFLHVEDIDICRRAELAGGSVIYTPLATALHHGATSNAPSLDVERHKANGLARYFARFANGPLEKAMVGIVSPVLGLAISVRAKRRTRGAPP